MKGLANRQNKRAGGEHKTKTKKTTGQAITVNYLLTRSNWPNSPLCSMKQSLGTPLWNNLEHLTFFDVSLNLRTWAFFFDAFEMRPSRPGPNPQPPSQQFNSVAAKLSRRAWAGFPRLVILLSGALGQDRATQTAEQSYWNSSLSTQLENLTKQSLQPFNAIIDITWIVALTCVAFSFIFIVKGH